MASLPQPPTPQVDRRRKDRSTADFLKPSTPPLSHRNRPLEPEWYFLDPEIQSPLEFLRDEKCDHLEDLMDLREDFDRMKVKVKRTYARLQKITEKKEWKEVAQVLEMQKQQLQAIISLMRTKQAAKVERDLELAEKQSKRLSFRAQKKEKAHSDADLTEVDEVEEVDERVA
eukprot:TRINITY_DN1984_c0_g1_i1.p1 TRINITY_DN1984_c0_g1~~TRINITY_DN1984_c0_g1_i1.p1  ORF type:complete len:172 (-),score=57.61 TRINITY_DN1984_c0_g1_i1:326-841(-)